jgi:hypothetical protein
VGPAVQLWHDVGDWRHDFTARRITYFISEVIRGLAAESEREVKEVLADFLEDHGWRTERDFHVFIGRQKIMAQYWGEAETWFNEALLFTQRPELQIWNSYLDQWIAELQTYILSVNDPKDPRGKPLTFLQIVERLAASSK